MGKALIKRGRPVSYTHEIRAISGGHKKGFTRKRFKGDDPSKWEEMRKKDIFRKTVSVLDGKKYKAEALLDDATDPRHLQAKLVNEARKKMRDDVLDKATKLEERYDRYTKHKQKKTKKNVGLSMAGAGMGLIGLGLSEDEDSDKEKLIKQATEYRLARIKKKRPSDRTENEKALLRNYGR